MGDYGGGDGVSNSNTNSSKSQTTIESTEANSASETNASAKSIVQADDTGSSGRDQNGQTENLKYFFWFRMHLGFKGC